METQKEQTTNQVILEKINTLLESGVFPDTFARVITDSLKTEQPEKDMRDILTMLEKQNALIEKLKN